MVGYTSSLSQARRPGWEEAYLDYHRLKKILEEISDLIESHGAELGSWSDRGRMVHDRISDLFGEFSASLQRNVEKISLFALSRQGALADSIGALRFGSSHMTRDAEEGGMKTSISFSETDDEDHVRFSGFGVEAALCPPTTTSYNSVRRSTSESVMMEKQALPIFRGDVLKARIGGENIDGFGRLDSYTTLGVELLHTLRYVCVNAMAIRKALKKHDKVFSKYIAVSGLQAQEEHVDKLVRARYSFPSQSHFQQLAKSSTIAAIDTSLVAALRDFEKLRSELPHVDEIDRSEEQKSCLLELGDLDHPSSALGRLHVTLSAIHVLRNYAAAAADNQFPVFLLQKAMIVTGESVGALGLEGTTHQALDLLLKFEPEAFLLLDDETLNRWRETVKSETPFLGEMMGAPIGGERGDRPVHKFSWGGIDKVSMVINLLSILLYTINYYIVAPTASEYALYLGMDESIGATLIGAASFSALGAAFIYSFWCNRGSFKSLLVFSAFCPFLGNIFYALAACYPSVALAMVGRLLVGLGSAEVVNRQVINACVSFSSMTRACALFVTLGALGMSLGPLLAAILELTFDVDYDVDLSLKGLPTGGIIVNNVTSPGYLMAGLWFCQLVAAIFLFQEPERINGTGFQQTEYQKTTKSSDNEETTALLDAASERSGSDLLLSYQNDHAKLEISKPKQDSTRWKAVKEELITTYALVTSNPALPLTFYLFFLIELTDEIIISSCAMVGLRYFDWTGSVAGFVTAALGALVLPAHVIVEHASRTYEERKIMRMSIYLILCSLVAMLNYEGLIYDVVGWVEAIFPPLYFKIGVNNNGDNEFPFDWGIGEPIYVVALSALFMGTIILEGVDTSLMSKASPAKLNEMFMNSGFLATVIGTLGRVLGDSLITLSGLLDQSLLDDFENSTFLPLIPFFLLGLWLVRRLYHRLVLNS